MTLPAAKELGDTQIAEELVPGKPGRLEANAQAMTREAEILDGRYTTLRDLRIDGWTGYAADAYERHVADELKKWVVYQDLLTTAGEALTTFAGALRSAQGKAADAIARYAAGEAETQRARDHWQQAVQAYEDAHRVCLVPTSTPVLLPGNPGPFVDTGQSMRDEAEEILREAREALDGAGAQAVRTLGGLPGGRTEGSTDWFGADGSVTGPRVSWKFWKDTFGKDPSDGPDGKYEDKHENDFVISVGKVEGSAWVFRAEGGWEDYWGPVHMNADGSFTFLGADGSAEATLTKEGLRINADGSIVVVGAEGEVTGEWGYLEGSLKGEAMIGADAGGHLVVGADGVHAGGELFAGAKAEATAQADFSGVGGKITAEGWAGAGIAGDLDLGYDDGKITLGGSGGIAWGVGGKLGGSVTIDVPEVIDGLGDAVDAIGDLFH
ncbi:MAG: hypothetical protein R2731_10025 [Nocardioides sp.]